ncbi:MAG TPA: ABC-F family ATP-binding cassette domain-containing protein [Phycisphaerales bacterium]|nr:ABC-F family ATP-binding cassette domain-containing protein [Phycisphaerales bacterium]
MLLSVRDVAKSHALRTLFQRLSFAIDEGDRLGLIGPNGAGKSTLLKLLAGEEPPDEGEIVASGRVRVAYVPQQDVFTEETLARDVVADAAFSVVGGVGVTHDRHEAEVLAEMTLSRLSFDEALAATSAGALSGGWRKRLAIARALAAAGGEPELLLLDEPTNHLDLGGIRWLEEFVRRPAATGRPFAAVFVTHDRVFLENVATRVMEISPAYPQGAFIVEGNYSEFVRRREEFLAGQARAEQAIAGQVRRDLAWLARGPQGRGTKAKGRIGASYARIDELADLRARNSAAAGAGARVEFDATGRRTRKLIAAKGVSKGFGGRVLFRDVDVALGVGDCLGLLGTNGSGKTTLIRVLTGELAPDAGIVERSDPPPRVVVFSQYRREFPPTTSLREALCPVSDQVRYRGQAMHVTAWSRRFLFRDEQLDQPVSSLSGGELARIHIARVMVEAADVLVLDEPTNDLDIPTLETLEEAMEDFPGAVILVTHDRAMLGRLATRVLALDGEGGARVFASLDQALAESDRRERERAAEAKRQCAAAPAAPAPARQAPRKKLSYMEQREYDGIEARIGEAEAKVAAAEARLSDPTVMADRAAMTRVCGELGAAQAEVAALYARWAELEARLA